MLKDKKLANFTNFISRNSVKKNDEIILEQKALKYKKLRALKNNQKYHLFRKYSNDRR